MKAKSVNPRHLTKRRKATSDKAPPLTFDEWKRAVGVPLLGTQSSASRRPLADTQSACHIG
jgi:hypothetical protein